MDIAAESRETVEALLARPRELALAVGTNGSSLGRGGRRTLAVK